MKYRRVQPGFALVEVLIAVVVISIVLIAAVNMTSRYLVSATWPKLFDAVEQEFLDVNTASLAGFSKSFADNAENIAEIPDMYHLYFEKGGEAGVWYLESRMQDPQSDEVEQRQITFQEFETFDVDPLELTKLSLHTTSDPNTNQVLSRDAILMSWSHPFSQLSFQFFDAKMSRTGSELSGQFALPDEPTDCVTVGLGDLKNCFVNLQYVRPGTTQEKSVVFGKQKGIYRDSL